MTCLEGSARRDALLAIVSCVRTAQSLVVPDTRQRMIFDEQQGPGRCYDSYLYCMRLQGKAHTSNTICSTEVTTKSANGRKHMTYACPGLQHLCTYTTCCIPEHSVAFNFTQQAAAVAIDAHGCRLCGAHRGLHSLSAQCHTGWARQHQ